ncbi:3-phenylpropionate MFS transporter [Photobacterium carnosum]|uniref:3-phenylpropionate MFS transporter n=1 Tax=Photobacterium carnosum TaxID=2023717 RepID=UPI001E51ED68|nr:3-phenylpropionate MFS transporter [Photobacterium carnosum]MCD9546285.1 3-phenylpropionate MFS transporter [Photobacterium carnosum]
MFKSKPYGWTSQYLLGFFFSYGVYLPFWAIWFKHIGVDDSDIGLLLGLGFAVRCIANLVITPRIHKVEHLIPALRGFTLLGLVACIIYIICGGNLWALAAVTVLFNLSAGPIVPISDAITNHYAKEGHLDYGRTRLWGSIAFIAGSTVVGVLAQRYGADIIPWVALAGLGFAQIMAARNPVVMPVDVNSHQQVRPALMHILRDSSVIKLMLITALLQGSHAAYYGFSSIYWQKIGFDESVIGYLWSFSVAAEVGMFLVSKRLFANWSINNMFRLAAVGVLVRWGLTATITDQWAMFAVQSLHSVTFAAAHLAAIRYIERSPSNHMVALQSLYNAIPLGAVMAVLTSISGWVYGDWGADVFWIMAVMALPVFFIRLPLPDEQPQTLTPQMN